MSDNISPAAIANFTPEQRLNYLLKEVLKQKQIWILTDEHGCVMLNTEDEDCVPIWPSQEDAQNWATGEWADCQAKAIDLKTWHSRWTDGLGQDEVAIAVFPSEEQDGLVISAQEFDFELKNKARKQS